MQCYNLKWKFYIIYYSPFRENLGMPFILVKIYLLKINIKCEQLLKPAHNIAHTTVLSLGGIPLIKCTFITFNVKFDIAHLIIYLMELKNQNTLRNFPFILLKLNNDLIKQWQILPYKRCNSALPTSHDTKILIRPN